MKFQSDPTPATADARGWDQQPIALPSAQVGPGLRRAQTRTSGGFALRAWLCALPLALACSAPGQNTRPQRAGFRGAAITLPLGVAQAEIAQLEDERPADASEIIAYLDNEDPAVRDRAALALGRFIFPRGGPNVTAALCRTLNDPDPQVRATAAFAIGIRGDLAGAGCLVNFASDPDARVRAALTRAAGHLDTSESREVVQRGLRDPDPQVRVEAVQATATWTVIPEEAGAIDSALLAAITQSAAAGGGREVTPELVWRTLYALSRRRSEKGRVAFHQYATSKDALARLFSMRGLARISTSPKALAALVNGSNDVDWRVAMEAALGLGDYKGDERAARALMETVEHRSHHVRRAAMQSLGKLEVDSKAVRSLLWRGARDLSASVRADAIVALVQLLPATEALSSVEDNRRDSDPLVRAGAARAAAELAPEHAVPILLTLANDSDARVVQAAHEGLVKHPTAAARKQLLVALEHPDNGVVLSAVTSLRESARGSDVAPLRAALDRVRGDIADEIALAIVESFAAIGSDSSRRETLQLANHPNQAVALRARRALRQTFEAPSPAQPITPATIDEIPRAGRDYPAWIENPLVEVRTTRGRMIFELFPAEAPIHVHNFLSLAEQEHYDGLTFHRVVPDFVVQGGDYRGDGNGGVSWRGGPMRAEFGKRKFGRGALGMPRYADPDSGGSQFFVTHRPTPHLDGRYTLFGEIREGIAVLDRIQVGDRILEIRSIRPAKAR